VLDLVIRGGQLIDGTVGPAAQQASASPEVGWWPSVMWTILPLR